MIQPSLGRVVWFTPAKDNPIPADQGGRCAAIVTHVHSDALVNLAVFDANGHHHPRTSVALVQEGDPKPEHGHYCEWMPYQKGQAAKTEAAEKALAAAKGPAEKGPDPAEAPAGKDQPARKGRP